MKSRAGTQSRPSGCWQSQQTAKVMRKPAGQESKSAGKGSCLNANDRRVQVQLTQEAKIVPGFPSYSGNFCVCRLCLRSDGVTNPGPVQVVKPPSRERERAEGPFALLSYPAHIWSRAIFASGRSVAQNENRFLAIFAYIAQRHV